MQKMWLQVVTTARSARGERHLRELQRRVKSIVAVVVLGGLVRVLDGVCV